MQTTRRTREAGKPVVPCRVLGGRQRTAGLDLGVELHQNLLVPPLQRLRPLPLLRLQLLPLFLPQLLLSLHPLLLLLFLLLQSAVQEEGQSCGV